MDQAVRDRDGATIPRSALLVVAGDLVVRSTIAATMRDHGFHVVEAADAEEAIALIQTPRARIGLVFTDEDLPGLLNGYDLVSWASAVRPELPVLLTSILALTAPAGDERRAANTVAKPYHADPVMRCMGEALTTRRPRADTMDKSDHTGSR